MTRKFVSLCLLIGGLFLFSCQQTPVQNTRKISSQENSAGDRAALKNLKDELAQIQKVWDDELTTDANGNSFYSPETNAKYLPQVAQLVRQIFAIENVKYTEPTEGRFDISYAPENKDASKLNHTAWSYFYHLDHVEISYDPLDLYVQNYGGGFDPDKNRISLSNPSMCTDIYFSEFSTWLTGNEVHESVHAKVDDLQKKNIWLPLWGELGSLDSTKPFRHPYDHSIFFDELMAYHKQLMYLMGNGFAALAKKQDTLKMAERTNGLKKPVRRKKNPELVDEKFKQLNKYFPILKNLVASIMTALPRFRGPILGHYELINSADQIDPQSNLFQIDIHSDRIGEHIVIYKDGYHLDLILKLQGYQNTDDKVRFAQDHIKKVEQIVRTLNSTYARFPILIKSKNLDSFDQAMNSVRDLIAFPKE